jgi:hypothetical protein
MRVVRRDRALPGRSVVVYVSALVLLAFAEELPAQRLLLEGGANVGTVPRALEPLCASARRLRGVGVTARGGLARGAFHVGATIDLISRIGVRDAADCVPRSGTTVDSAFAPAGNSATSLGINGWVSIKRVLQFGAETGWIVNHSAWFVGPTLGVQFGRVRAEAGVRRHIVKFDEITRVYGNASVIELSRASRSESSWGGVARLLLIAF